MLSDSCLDFVSDVETASSEIVSRALHRLEEEVGHYSHPDFGYPAEAIALGQRAITMSLDGTLPMERLTAILSELADACYHGHDDSPETLARINAMLEA